MKKLNQFLKLVSIKYLYTNCYKRFTEIQTKRAQREERFKYACAFIRDYGNYIPRNTPDSIFETMCAILQIKNNKAARNIASDVYYNNRAILKKLPLAYTTPAVQDYINKQKTK